MAITPWGSRLFESGPGNALFIGFLGCALFTCSDPASGTRHSVKKPFYRKRPIRRKTFRVFKGDHFESQTVKTQPSGRR